jgi:LacI family transcriptional regulator
MGVSVQDVAKLAGVSPSAAGRILHGGRFSIRIIEAEEAKIRAAAKAIGYEPTLADLQMARVRPYSILLAMPEWFKISGDSLYFASVLEGAMTAAFNSGFNLSVAPVSSASNIVEIAMNGQHEGVVWTVFVDYGEGLKDLSAYGMPVVVLHGNGTGAPEGVVCYVGDNEQGVNLAVDHLVKLGHRNLAFVTYIGAVQREFRIRSCAFEETLARHGIVALPEIEIDVDKPAPIWRKLVDEGLTGVLCASEGLAGTVLRAAAAESLWLPDELSVVGFDSTFYCETTVPKMTSVYQPLYEMAYEAVRKLIETSWGFEDLGDHRTFDCRFDVRESTAPPVNI